MTPEEKLFYEVETNRLCDRPDIQPTYDEKLKVARYVAGFPDDSLDGHHVLKLISLVGYLTMAARVKTPECKPLHILAKAWGKPGTHGIVAMYDRFSILCELFITPHAKFSTYGCTTAQEMLDAIKETMDIWLPF